MSLTGGISISIPEDKKNGLASDAHQSTKDSKESVVPAKKSTRSSAEFQQGAFFDCTSPKNAPDSPHAPLPSLFSPAILSANTSSNKQVLSQAAQKLSTMSETELNALYPDRLTP